MVNIASEMPAFIVIVAFFCAGGPLRLKHRVWFEPHAVGLGVFEGGGVALCSMERRVNGTFVRDFCCCSTPRPVVTTAGSRRSCRRIAANDRTDLLRTRDATLRASWFALSAPDVPESVISMVEGVRVGIHSSEEWLATWLSVPFLRHARVVACSVAGVVAKVRRLVANKEGTEGHRGGETKGKGWKGRLKT